MAATIARDCGPVLADRHHIPASHLDLVDCPRVAALTTVMPDGSPQTTVGEAELLTMYPNERRDRETRVTCRICARRVTLDAIHR